MKGTVVALWLCVVGTEVTSAVAENTPALTIDPCVTVDETTVRQLMELEIRGARLPPTSVSVRCVGEAQEIRIEPWASLEQEGLRTIQLPVIPEDAAPAARQARSRELALAIAEFIRRHDTAPPPAQAPSSPPPAAVSVVPASPVRPTGGPKGHWRLGTLWTFEYFSGRQNLTGADLVVGARLGRWFLAELRAGGRLGTEETLPGGRLTARAAAAAAAGGLYFRSPHPAIGAAVMLRVQAYLVQFRAEDSGRGDTRTVLLGAFALAAEPRLMVAFTRRFSVETSASVGLLPRGIVVRTQGTEAPSISGFVVSGSLGGVLTF